MKFLVTSIIVAIGALAYWQFARDPDVPNPPAMESACSLWADDASPVLTVDLGINEMLDRPNVTLTIPESYILPRSLGRYRSGRLDGAALIYAQLPDFRPQSPKIDVDPTSDTADQTARILITTYVDMDTILASKINIWGRPADGVTFPKIQANAGLMQVDYPIYGTPAFETFFAQSADEITDVMVCDNKTQDAGCRHQFDAGVVEVTVSYRRSNLDQWAQIRSSAQALLNCFTTTTDQD